jgi:hypothetical protein
MTLVTNDLTLLYDIKQSRKQSLADLEDWRAYCGITDAIMDDARGTQLLAMAARRIKSMTNRSNIDGIINKEKLGRSDGSKRDFYTLFKPILHAPLDRGGEITRSSAAVQVFTLNRNSDSFVRLDHSTYGINGESGHIWFKQAYVPAPGLDVFCSYFYDNELLIQAQMALAASWAFGQLAPTENRDGRPQRYMAEFEKLMQNFVGEDHAFFATKSEQQRDRGFVSRSYVEQT